MNIQGMKKELLWGLDTIIDFPICHIYREAKMTTVDYLSQVGVNVKKTVREWHEN